MRVDALPSRVGPQLRGIFFPLYVSFGGEVLGYASVIYIVSGAISSAVVLGLALRSRRRVSGVEGYLNVPIAGLVELTVGRGEYRFEFPEDVVGSFGSSFSGVWTCCRVGSGAQWSVYKCGRGGTYLAVKVPKGLERVIEEYEVGGPPSRTGADVMDFLRGFERRVGDIVESARRVMELEHPHVLKLRAYSTSIPLLVYEYASQGSLQYQLVSGRRFSFKEVVVLAVQLADALRYLHAHGMVHGDVKPGNVLFVNGVAKLGDVAPLAKAFLGTEVAGTRGWRAPEQVNTELYRGAVARGYVNRVDVYQLANVVLYLLTGKTVDGEARLIMDEDRLSTVLREVKHGELEELLKEMLEVEPWRRPAADEVVRRLLQLLR